MKISKTDPLCKRCQKDCKQVRPAIVVSCAKFILLAVKLPGNTMAEPVPAEC